MCKFDFAGFEFVHGDDRERRLRRQGEQMKDPPAGVICVSR
jgi:hypothetical protein